MEKTLEKPISKKVLLFSGGLDSFVAAKLWKPDVLLYIAIGHAYEAVELECINRLGFAVSVDRRLHLGDLERVSDGIIPLRNLYFAAIASHYGDEIGMGVVDGEINGDKSEAFYNRLRWAINIAYAPSYWSEGRQIKFSFPVRQYSKAELVGEYLKSGGSPEELLKTKSCYAPTAIHCGKCSSCLKRFIALKINDLSEPYESDPRKSPYIPELQRRWSTFGEKRKAEILQALPHLEVNQ